MKRLRGIFVFCVSLCFACAFAATSGASQRSGGERGAKQGQAANRQPARHAARIDSRAEFDAFARIYYRGRFYALPHVMFVIDRRERNRVYYANSKVYQFHKDFVNANYLSLERGRAFYENNYLRGDRRFLLGTIAFQSAVGKFTYEFWEGDRLTAQLINEAHAALSKSFFAPLAFKPNSLAQEEVVAENNKVAKPGIPVLTTAELARDQEYQPLNLGSGLGQLRIIDRLTPDMVIDRNQIVIFKEVPVQLTPLSGIITTEGGSPLSHANLLAKSWSIPNAQIRNAEKLFKQLEGKYVKLEVRENDYTLALADPGEAQELRKQWIKRADTVTPPADLKYAVLADLKDQRARDARRFGAKSANLGEMVAARLPRVIVPRGFTVPFHYYRQFILRNNLEERIASAVEEDRFVHDPVYRKKRLQEVRGWIQAGRHDDSFKRAVLEKFHNEYGGKGLFVRSSTNAEDLPNFSGAGLYTTVPNVRTDDQLMEAIKTVWASVWNYEAYEARESFGMNHFGVYPAVLVQEGIDADSAGVAITADPFDKEGKAAVYINAKRGLGIKVVEGRRVPEQVIFRPRAGTIQVLTRSDEDTMLAFDEQGGVKEVKVDERRAVLTDGMVRRLARAALAIERVFGGRDQDIEWLYKGGTLYIVQSRPYVEGN